MKELSIIMPAWNEGKVIFNSIKGIEKTLSNPGKMDYEIIVVLEREGCTSRLEVRYRFLKT